MKAYTQRKKELWVQKIYRNRAQELENVISRVVLVLDERGYLVDTQDKAPRSPPIPGTNLGAWAGDTHQAASRSRMRCVLTQPRLLPVISKDKGEQEAFVLLWQRVTETRSQGWGRNGGKLYVWRQKLERQQRWTVKTERGKNTDLKCLNYPWLKGLVYHWNSVIIKLA